VNHAVIQSNGVAHARNEPALSRGHSHKAGLPLPNGGPMASTKNGAAPSRPHAENNQVSMGIDPHHQMSMQRTASEQISSAHKLSRPSEVSSEPYFWRLSDPQKSKSMLAMMGMDPDGAADYSMLFNSLKTEMRLGLQQIFKKVCETTARAIGYKIHRLNYKKHVLQWIFATLLALVNSSKKLCLNLD